MSIAQDFLSEFEIQARNTRKFLERIPEDKLTWKPNEKSMTFGQLGFHIGFVPGGIAQLVVENPAHAPENPFVFPQPASLAEILKAHDSSVAAVRSLLPKFNDAAMQETWILMGGSQHLVEVPRMVFVRDILLSHWYQHRGQLCVYLRMHNIAVPATWGPSADEAPNFVMRAELATAAA